MEAWKVISMLLKYQLLPNQSETLIVWKFVFKSPKSFLKVFTILKFFALKKNLYRF